MRRILLGLAATLVLGLILLTVLIVISSYGTPDGRSQVGPPRDYDLAAADPHDPARPSGIPGTGADDIDLAAAVCEAALARAPQDPRLLFETGRVADVGRDADKARAFYEQAAGQGHAAAQARLGEFRQVGVGGLSRDDDESARLYKPAASQGDTAGQALIGNFYQAGRGGLVRGDAEAARLCKLPAGQGDADGQAGLGALDENGLGGLTRNNDEAAPLYKLAADQGHAQNNLGIFHRRGLRGVTKDDNEAARLFRLAADQGHPHGQLNLAYFYEKGRGGLPPDSEEAARLYELAEAQGATDQAVVRAAPTTAAEIAYNYLQDHYTSNGIINYKISTYDNNVCHLRYLFFAEADFNIKYDFDAADIRLDTVKSVPPRQGGAQGIGFAGIDLEAAPGRHFKADGRIKRASLPPAASSIRLLATVQPDAAMVQALVKLATECGAKPPPSSVVQ